MASLPRRYVEAIRSLFGKTYWATWEPSVRHTLGEIGIVEHGTLIGIDHLKDHGIALTPEPVAQKDQETYRSDRSVKVTMKAAGSVVAGLQILGDAEAGAVVEFGREGGVLMDLTGVSHSRLPRQPALARYVVQEWREGRWPEHQCIVTQIVSAEKGTILASWGGHGRAELRFAAAPGAAIPVDGNLSAGFSVAHAQGLGVRIAGEALTPVFRVLGLKRTWLGRIKTIYGNVQPFRTGGLDENSFRQLLDEAGDEPEVVLGELDQLDHLDDDGSDSSTPAGGR